LDLVDARPTLPDELSDRQWDVVEPLLAIADAAGGEWPAMARRALVELCAEGRASDDSIGKQLLTDIKNVFQETGIGRISSVNLAEALGKREDSPWAEWGKGEKPITAPKVAALLKPYGIHPHPVRDGSKVFKGYEASDFEDAWNRYVTPTSVESPQELYKDLLQDYRIKGQTVEWAERVWNVHLKGFSRGCGLPTSAQMRLPITSKGG
jgi:hypothetical protein